MTSQLAVHGMPRRRRPQRCAACARRGGKRPTMEDDRLDEILRRLEDIEEALYQHLNEHDQQPVRHSRPRRTHEHREPRRRRYGFYDEGPRGPVRGPESGDHRGQPFDEKRVVDLIVSLVGQRVEDILERRACEEQARDSHGESGSRGSPDASDE